MAKTYTTTSSNTNVATDQTGLENIDGLAIVAGGDVVHNVTVTETDGDVIGKGIELLRDFDKSLQENYKSFTGATLSVLDNTLGTVLEKNQKILTDGIITAQQPDTESMKEIIKIIAIGLVLSFAVMRLAK